MYGYIYMTTNLIDGRQYIGQKKSSKFLHEKYLGSGKILKQAIESYGKENFKVEMLCECESKEELDEMEIYYIKFYYAQSNPHYYNICKGGQAGPGGPRFKGHKHTDETKQKMSENRSGEKNANYGNHWKASDEYREFCKQKNSGTGNPMYGKKHSSDTKNKISAKNKGRFVGYIKITNGQDNKMIKPEELDAYLVNGWRRGCTTSKSKNKT